MERILGKPSHRKGVQLAKRYGLSETSLTRLFVLAVHVFGCLRQRLNRCIQIDAMPRSNFVAGDRIRRPRLDGAKGTSLDTRDLHVTGNRVASHAEVMFESRFRGVLNHPRLSIECGSN